jgi:hypothetical protein
MQSSKSTDSLASGSTSGQESSYDNSDYMPKAVPGFVFRHFLHEDAKVGKLITREDPHHIHKTLGILSVVSFCYRYRYVFNVTGDLGFDGSALDWASMAVHTLLALSSILFRVPRKHINAKPMVIYEAYR